jgi:uncharacterized protein (UPF0218 family)
MPRMFKPNLRIIDGKVKRCVSVSPGRINPSGENLVNVSNERRPLDLFSERILNPSIILSLDL